MHFRHDAYDLHVLEQNGVVDHLLACVIDAIPLELGAVEGLPLGRAFEQVDAGGIDFLGEHERSVNPCACQLAGVIVSGNGQAMILGQHFDAALTPFNIHRTLDVRAAVIFQPQVNGNCHVKLLLSEHECRVMRQGVANPAP
ncbi:hypothetical protein D3C73_835420 [compost metagenome]